MRSITKEEQEKLLAFGRTRTMDMTDRYIDVDDATRSAVEQLATGHESGHDSEPDIVKKPQIM